APGEAEAELATLNARGYIDAVITDDVDAFIFGANTVIRTSNINTDGDHISIYTSQTFQDHPQVCLTVSRIFLIAILSGGDYSKGLPGCGIKIAHTISLRTTLGEELYTAAHTLPRQELTNYLNTWRKQLKAILLENPGNILGARYPAIAHAISCKFPDLTILQYYVNPSTSFSNDIESINIAELYNCSLTQPDLSTMAVWCEKYFSWYSNGSILDRFRSRVWSSICTRALMLPSIGIDVGIATHVLGNSYNTTESSRPHILKINRASLGPGPPSKHPNVWGYSVQIPTYLLIQSTLSKLELNITTAASTKSLNWHVSTWTTKSTLKYCFQ
ncbi:hypothetical protein H0H87_008181, partial [Tephrocybe sp. NHM501043]